jgi:hypothetical protein
MTLRRSSGPPQPHSPGRRAGPKRLRADIVGGTPLEVLKALAHEARVAGQIGVMSREALARALAVIDEFNALAHLPALYLHLTPRMQHEIDLQRALRVRSSSSDPGLRSNRR